MPCRCMNRCNHERSRYPWFGVQAMSSFELGTATTPDSAFDMIDSGFDPCVTLLGQDYEILWRLARGGEPDGPVRRERMVNDDQAIGADRRPRRAAIVTRS